MELLFLLAAFFVTGFFFRPKPIQSEELHPVPNPKAVVTVGKARFTVLFPEMIRMEWAPNGKFEDRASLAFIDRNQPVPRFRVSTEGDWLVINTGKLKLFYKKSGERFSADNLRVELTVAGKRVVWKPGTPDEGNLFGTIRTLDTISGSTPLERGLLSRQGWVLVNDSNTPLFTATTPPWVVPRSNSKAVDWYFFGYGHEYKKALSDFTKIAGKIPMPPKFAFGAWWSRYWSYTDKELEDLVRQFQNHTVPVDVLVVDMGWHLKGWTGYTWNPVYFPDPKRFAQWVHRQGLKLTLNLHPASGVKAHEKAYRRMARAMGIDPETKQTIPFDPTDPKFVDAYFRYLHHPLEKDGVDFWWLDWQQGTHTKIPGLDPLWWLNYLHFTDMARFHPNRRPLIFSRWGGLGNHRYQIGFSGDVRSTWASLAFQPYFTSTAANVGYGYWSHDIGGHWGNKLSPELYLRWIQWGAFSPILRTHVTDNPSYERRIWAYPYDAYRLMRQAFLRRYALLPYIYTEARRTFDTGVAFLHPTYYEYPEKDEAYRFKNQYFFGENLLVAPITAPVDTVSGIAVESVWLPPGTDWFEWDTGRLLKGGQVVSHGFSLEQIPVYAKAGTIVPMQSPVPNTGTRPDRLIVTIFPGEKGHYRLYEDQGNSQDYRKNVCAWTTIRQETRGGVQKIWFGPTEGKYPGMPDRRKVEIRLVHTWPPQSVFVNGQALKQAKWKNQTGYWYDGEHVTTVIQLPEFSVLQRQEIVVQLTDFGSENDLLQAFPNKLARLKAVKKIMRIDWPESLIKAIQTGNRMEIHPDSALSELRAFESNLPKVVHDMLKQNPNEKEFQEALAHLFGFYQTVTLVPTGENHKELLAKVRVGLADADWREIEKVSRFSGKISLTTRGAWTLKGTKTKTIESLLNGPVDLKRKISLEHAQDPGEFESLFETTVAGRALKLSASKAGYQAITHWWVLGPFPNPNPKNLDIPFIKETSVTLDPQKPIVTRTGEKMTWREMTPQVQNADAFEDFSLDFFKLFPQMHENAVAYALTILQSDRNTAALLALGSDDAVAVWVNGKLVHKNPTLRAYREMEYKVPIRFKKGRNLILAKVTQAGGGWAFGAHLLTLRYTMLEGVRVVRK